MKRLFDTCSNVKHNKYYRVKISNCYLTATSPEEQQPDLESQAFFSVSHGTNRFQRDHRKCLSDIISVFSSGGTGSPSEAFHTLPKWTGS